MISTIGFDADDTLWHNESYFKAAEARFAELLAGYGEAEHLLSCLIAAERRNIGTYGFGVKGFTLSMIETAVEVSGGRVAASVISELIETGRAILEHPVELLPHAQDAVAALAGDFRLVLITKGDLLHQERKLANSGLAGHFHGVEIVSDKTAETYRHVFARHGAGPERALMAGNSLKSDVIPAIQAGSFGVHVPHGLSWELEAADAPQENPRFHTVNDLGGLPELVHRLTERKT